MKINKFVFTIVLCLLTGFALAPTVLESTEIDYKNCKITSDFTEIAQRDFEQIEKLNYYSKVNGFPIKTEIFDNYLTVMAQAKDAPAISI